jgi:hypothetical protein
MTWVNVSNVPVTAVTGLAGKPGITACGRAQ